MNDPDNVPTDTILLNWLSSLPTFNGSRRWKFRRSTTGREWRLLTTSEEPNYATPREALLAAYEECHQELDALDRIIGDS